MMEKIDIDAILAKATPRPWRETTWDFKTISTGPHPSVLAFACGPQHVSRSPDKIGGDNRHLLPDRKTADRVYADAELLNIAVSAFEPMREALKIAVEALDVSRHDPGPWLPTVYRDALARIRKLVPEMVTK